MSVRAVYDFATQVVAKTQETASAIPEGLASFQKSISSTTFAFQKAIIPYVPAVTSQSLLLSAIMVHLISTATGNSIKHTSDDEHTDLEIALYMCALECLQKYCLLYYISIEVDQILIRCL